MQWKLALPLTRPIQLLLAAKKDIRPVPCEQRSRPGQCHHREVRMRGELTGVHHLRNVFRRREHGAAYARTLVRRGPLKRQKFKLFVIDFLPLPEGHHFAVTRPPSPLQAGPGKHEYLLQALLGEAFPVGDRVTREKSPPSWC